MAAPFLITGMPRSRTAWWSVVTSTARSICTHEPEPDRATFEGLGRYFKNDAFEFSGISDSSIVTGLIGPVLQEWKPRTLIVLRPRDQVLRSFLSYAKHAPVFNAHILREQLERWDENAKSWATSKHPLVKVVDFGALENLAVVQECFEWLMPGGPKFNPALLHMNVQVDPNYFASVLARAAVRNAK